VDQRLAQGIELKMGFMMVLIHCLLLLCPTDKGAFITVIGSPTLPIPNTLLSAKLSEKNKLNFG